LVRVYKLKHFNIYSNFKDEYIVHNTRKDFQNGHTHIKNFNTAKYVAYLAVYKRLPKKNHLSVYLIDSVIRVSDDNTYIRKMKNFKKEMENKKTQLRS